MATVRMKRGDKYADVFDSPETIKQAQLDGYTLVETKKTEPVKAEEVKTEEVKTETVEEEKPRTKR